MDKVDGAGGVFIGGTRADGGVGLLGCGWYILTGGDEGIEVSAGWLTDGMAVEGCAGEAPGSVTVLIVCIRITWTHWPAAAEM